MAHILPQFAMADKRPDDYPQTPDTLARARAAQDAERRQAELESGCTLKFDGDRPYLASDDDINALRQLARVRPFPVDARVQRQNDELFVAPTAVNHVHALQLAESEQAEEIADRIAEVMEGAESCQSIPDRKTQATCRFLAVHAVRMMQPHWQDAAMAAAIQRAVTWFQQEGGARFRGLTEPQLEALSTFLAPKVICAYHGISEGTAVLPPGRYLSIVQRRAR